MHSDYRPLPMEKALLPHGRHELQYGGVISVQSVVGDDATG